MHFTLKIHSKTLSSLSSKSRKLDLYKCLTQRMPQYHHPRYIGWFVYRKCRLRHEYKPDYQNVVLDSTDFLLPASYIKHIILIKVIHTYILPPQITFELQSTDPRLGHADYTRPIFTITWKQNLKFHKKKKPQ